MIETFATAKKMLDFTKEDADRLKAMAPLFVKHGPAITEYFYAQLHTMPEASALIGGKEAHLKETHQAWMAGLFAGEYGEKYLEERMRIGLTHVRVNIPQEWVEYVMGILRVKCLEALQTECEEVADLVSKYSSLVKILDLDLLIINLAYAEERLSRLTNFTGMSRKLLERCITQG